MQGKQGEVFVQCINDLGAGCLNQVALGPKDEVEKVATCAHLPLRGQGSDKDP